MHFKHFPILIIGCLLFATANLCRAEEAETTRGKLLVEYDFSSAELGKEFIVKRGEWKVEDGAHSAREIE
jgi:hypothetical protein